VAFFYYQKRRGERNRHTPGNIPGIVNNKQKPLQAKTREQHNRRTKILSARLGTTENGWKKMDHNTSYLQTEYGREKMIESYHREEKENTAKEKGATTGGVHAFPPAPEKDDGQNN